MNDDNDIGFVMKHPVSIRDILKKEGTHFEIHSNFDDDPIGEELFDEVSDDDVDPEEKIKEYISPCQLPFSELREQMQRVDNYIYKKVLVKGDETLGPVPENARISIHYNAYWELSSAPFDSSYMRGVPLTYCTNTSNVLEGLQAAVRTMYSGEESQFVISYQLLFREMGCPPRVKPKADGLFVIKLLKFTAIGDTDALDNMENENRNNFSVVHGKVKEAHLKGLDLFRNGRYTGAVKAFHSAVAALDRCNLANQEEEDTCKNLKVKLYTNLAVCYNKLSLPRKTCCMCNEIRNITNIQKNCKALFQEGRALLMLGEYDRSRSQLMRASRLEPHNEEINKELKKLQAKHEKFKIHERTLAQNALGIMKAATSNSSMEVDSKGTSFIDDETQAVIERFKNDDNITSLNLPADVPLDEIRQLARDMNLKCTVSPVTNGCTLSKLK